MLLCFDAGVYCGLNPVGSHIWKLLAEKLPVPAVIDRIQEVQLALDRCLTTKTSAFISFGESLS